MKNYIIAEAGVNHNGSMDIAYKLIDEAYDAGADAVKFQTFNTKNLVTGDSPKAEYQKLSTDSKESQFSMLKKLELSKENHYLLNNYCLKKGIDFLSTAFDIDSLKFLVNEIRPKKLKIASGELTNGPFLLAHTKTKPDILLSTGMSTFSEINDALEVLAFGLIGDKKTKPSKDAFRECFKTDIAQEILRKKVTILHCTSEYPAPMNEINLKAMESLSKRFGLKVGYSDHSEGTLVPILAASMGATVIEKHLTLDKKMLGPDHQASIEPFELRFMIESIRSLEKIMGDSKKFPSKSEIKNIKIVRKSLVASRDIKKGEKFSKDNLTAKRPGDGLNPMHYWNLLGKRSKTIIKEGELIDE